MKRILSCVLIGVFALSFVAGALVPRVEAETVPLCWKAGDCNYETGEVWTCCLVGKQGKGKKCFWSDEYFDQWCPQ